jgi:hypothetical protein
MILTAVEHHRRGRVTVRNRTDAFGQELELRLKHLYSLWRMRNQKRLSKGMRFRLLLGAILKLEIIRVSEAEGLTDMNKVWLGIYWAKDTSAEFN